MKYSDETIMKLIKYGFKFELIANELDVTIDYVYTINQKMKQQGLLSKAEIARNPKTQDDILIGEKKDTTNTATINKEKQQVPVIKNDNKSNDDIKEKERLDKVSESNSKKSKLSNRKSISQKEAAKKKLQKLMFKYRTVYDGSVKFENEKQINTNNRKHIKRRK